VKLVVGLGNPGPRYAGTRHNVGFMAVEEFASDRSPAWTVRREARSAAVRCGDVDVLLLEPLAFMNLSGGPVAQCQQFFRIENPDLLVVHDDVDLPLGRLMVKAGGGDAGHKGIRSIIAEIGTSEFVRIRVGVGRPTVPADGDVVDWVLRPFAGEELDVLDAVLQRAAVAIEDWVVGGVPRAKNRANRRERRLCPDGKAAPGGATEPSCPGRDPGPPDRKEGG
jgi:peptidyl-tRNA hydrolase, PTH1 family